MLFAGRSRRVVDVHKDTQFSDAWIVLAVILLIAGTVLDNGFLTGAAAVLLLASAVSAAAGSVDAVLANVSAHNAAEMIQQRLGESEFVLLDIRTPAEFSAARLEGAVNLDYYASDFARRLAGLDRDKTYLIYCRVGNRTGRTMPVMERLGFRRVFNLAGGIVDWYRRGLPVVTGAPTPAR